MSILLMEPRGCGLPSERETRKVLTAASLKCVILIHILNILQAQLVWALRIDLGPNPFLSLFPGSHAASCGGRDLLYIKEYLFPYKGQASSTRMGLHRPVPEIQEGLGRSSS